MTRRELLGSVAMPVASATGSPRPAWDASGQVRRRKEIYELHRKHNGLVYKARELRVLLWNAMALVDAPETLEQGCAALAQVLAVEPVPDHFVEIALAQLLATLHRQIPDASLTRLRDRLSRVLERDAHRPIRFLGHNANFPAMATATCILAGQALGRGAALERGAEALDDLTRLFLRRGLLSEFTSPTYSPITLLCFAEIAQHCRNAEIVRLASAIEERLWEDLASHFHRPTNLLAGPYSRAYTVDSAGHPHHVQMTLYHVFGDRLWMTPRRFLFPPVEGQVVHHREAHFMQASNVWLASSTYHPSARIAEMLLDKPFPFGVSATAEFGAGSRERVLVRGADPHGRFSASEELFEYPAGELVSTTYMTRDYAVGSATAQYGDGNQTDAFHVSFLRSDPARSLQDVSTIYCRYLTNGNGPGVPWSDPRKPGSAGTDMVGDAGRVRAVQKNSTIMALYQAKGQVLDVFTSLRLGIVIPVFYRKLRRVLAGDRVVDKSAPFTSATPDIVWIEDDLLYAAFRPLVLTNHGRTNALRIATENGYLVIALVNYEGPGRRFTRRELTATRNGFVAELGSRREETFAAFQQRVLSGQMRDDVMSGERHAEYRREGLHLAIGHSLAYDGLKYILVDDKPLERPRFKAARITT